MKVQHLPKPNFSDTLVIGDVHGNYSSFLKAVKFADDNNLFVISLGDIVDYGFQSYEVFSYVNMMVATNKMAMVMGNHENKIMRYFSGNNVIMEDKHMVTVDSFTINGDPTGSRFLKFIQDIPHIITMDDHIFVHAGIHKRFWQSDLNSKMKKAIVGTALYGQIDRDTPTLDDGFPNRIYDWERYIPDGKTVYIGHDVFSSPVYTVNDNGGASWKIDTGSSKGGYLSGIVIGTQDVIEF